MLEWRRQWMRLQTNERDSIRGVSLAASTSRSSSALRLFLSNAHYSFSLFLLFFLSVPPLAPLRDTVSFLSRIECNSRSVEILRSRCILSYFLDALLSRSIVAIYEKNGMIFFNIFNCKKVTYWNHKYYIFYYLMMFLFLVPISLN